MKWYKTSYMKLTSICILTLFTFSGCVKSIIIPDAKYNAPVISFGNSPERNFFVNKPISDSLQLKWTADINGGLNTSAITIHGETVFCSDLSGRVYSFKLNDGKEIGYLNYKSLINVSPIVYQLKMIYPAIETKENKTIIYQYDFRLGKVIYEIEIPGKVIKEMISLEDGFIVFTEQGSVFRYHYNSSKIWEYDNENFIHSTAAASKDKIIFGDDKGLVTILDINSGNKVAELKLKSGIESGFSVNKNKVYCGDNEGNVYSIDLSTNKILWTSSIGFKTVTFPMIDDNSLFIGNLEGELYKLNLIDGRVIWKTETKGNINTTGLVFNNFIVQPDYNKKILFIDKEDGRVINSIQFEDKLKLSPFYLNDLLLFGTETGQLFAYEIISK